MTEKSLHFLCMVLMAVLATMAVTVSRHAAAAIVPTTPDCISLAKKAEQTHGLPDGILQSISIVEASRIQPDGTYKAWPWTLNDAGKGLFFDDAEQVLDYLDSNMSHPDASIDIGCMQINTKWHGAFFETLDEMLDPSSNISYAASFLSDLYHAHGNWDDAIRHYHSSEPKRNGPYLERVLASWTQRNPGAQKASLNNAVFEVALAPVATAADDAFRKALEEANRASAKQLELPIALPIAKPVVKPVAKPITKPAAKPAIEPVAPLKKLEIAKPVVPIDPDSKVKNRQRNLVEQWERVLMFRAQFAAAN
jgi:hypothetical protein